MIGGTIGTAQGSIITGAEPIFQLALDSLPLPPAALLGAGPANTHSATYRDTIMRFVAIRLLGWGMREKDIRYLCGVPEYFLSRVVSELAGESMPGGNVARRGSGGSAPGVWSVCETKLARLEAARFVVDWVAGDLPFDKQPDPIAFEAAYRRYRDWGWSYERRHWLLPSACLAIIRNVRSSELLLNRCLMCKRLSIQASMRQRVGRGGGRCSYCGSTQKAPCLFTPDHRVVNPA